MRKHRKIAHNWPVKLNTGTRRYGCTRAQARSRLATFPEINADFYDLAVVYAVQISLSWKSRYFCCGTNPSDDFHVARVTPSSSLTLLNFSILFMHAGTP